MKKCKECNEYHPANHPHFKVVSKLNPSGFPLNQKGYAAAHEQANKAEEAKFGRRRFEALEPEVKKAGRQHTLIGKNLSSGIIEVAKEVPPKFRNEVAYHEETENHILRRK